MKFLVYKTVAIINKIEVCGFSFNKKEMEIWNKFDFAPEYEDGVINHDNIHAIYKFEDIADILSNTPIECSKKEKEFFQRLFAYHNQLKRDGSFVDHFIIQELEY